MATGGAHSSTASKKKSAPAPVDWVRVAGCCCCWCVTTPSSRGCGGSVVAADPAPMSRASSLEYTPSGSPDPAPPPPWNIPASSPEYTPSTPSEYTPLTPSSGAASPYYTPLTPVEYTPSTPRSGAALPSSSSLAAHAFSPRYTPGTPSSSAASADYTPSTPPPSHKIPEAEPRIRSSSCSPSSSTCTSRIRRRHCLHTKTYLAFFTPPN